VASEAKDRGVPIRIGVNAGVCIPTSTTALAERP